MGVTITSGCQIMISGLSAPMISPLNFGLIGPHPVEVLSDIPVFREVAGDAATYFTAGDPNSLAATLDTVITVGTGANRRIGIDRAAEFSWRRTARETAHAYRLALDYDGGTHVG